MDKQPDDEVMHLSRAGKADRLADQTRGPSPQRQMLPLDLLRVPFARFVRVRSEMTRVRTPRIGIIARDTKRFQQGFELQKYRIVAAPPRRVF